MMKKIIGQQQIRQEDLILLCKFKTTNNQRDTEIECDKHSVNSFATCTSLIYSLITNEVMPLKSAKLDVHTRPLCVNPVTYNS